MAQVVRVGDSNLAGAGVGGAGTGTKSWSSAVSRWACATSPCPGLRRCAESLVGARPAPEGPSWARRTPLFLQHAFPRVLPRRIFSSYLNWGRLVGRGREFESSRDKPAKATPPFFRFDIRLPDSDDSYYLLPPCRFMGGFVGAICVLYSFRAFHPAVYIWPLFSPDSVVSRL